MQNRLVKALICIAVTAVIWLMPVPAGLKAQSWQLLAIFAGTICAFIVQPLPNSACVLIAMVFAVGLKVITQAEMLSSWANPTVWLVVAAFMFAKGFIKTGLGRRLAFLLTRSFGDSTLKLAYVLSINDLILAPATPSNTARAGGVLFPIVKSLCVAFESYPGPSARRIGSFLILSVIFVDSVTSAMFMTSMVSNPFIAELAQKTLNINISWGLWFQAAIVPGLVAMAVIPLFLYKVFPPELKFIPEAKQIAQQELDKMGPATLQEKIMAVVFVLVLGLWSTSNITDLDATFIGLVGVCLMLVTRVIDWQDVAEEKGAWDTFVWLGGMIGLAGLLAKYGFIAWFAKAVAGGITGIAWVPALVILLIVYMYAHYGFASLSAHVAALYAAFAAVAVAAGAPKFLTALSLAYVSSLCATLTNFGSAPTPIYYAAGYVDQGTWWKYGFYVSIINMVIWVGIGGIWWKILGLW